MASNTGWQADRPDPTAPKAPVVESRSRGVPRGNPRALRGSGVDASTGHEEALGARWRRGQCRGTRGPRSPRQGGHDSRVHELCLSCLPFVQSRPLVDARHDARTHAERWAEGGLQVVRRSERRLPASPWRPQMRARGCRCEHPAGALASTWTPQARAPPRCPRRMTDRKRDASAQLALGRTAIAGPPDIGDRRRPGCRIGAARPGRREAEHHAGGPADGPRRRRSRRRAGCNTLEDRGPTDHWSVYTHASNRSSRPSPKRRLVSGSGRHRWKATPCVRSRWSPRSIRARAPESAAESAAKSPPGPAPTTTTRPAPSEAPSPPRRALPAPRRGRDRGWASLDDSGPHRRHRPGNGCGPRRARIHGALAKRATASSGAEPRRARASAARPAHSLPGGACPRQTRSPAPGSAASVAGADSPGGGGEARTRPESVRRSPPEPIHLPGGVVARHPLTDPDDPCASRLSTCPPRGRSRRRRLLTVPTSLFLEQPSSEPSEDRLGPGLSGKRPDAPARVRGGVHDAHRGRGRCGAFTRSSPETPTGLLVAERIDEPEIGLDQTHRDLDGA